MLDFCIKSNSACVEAALTEGEHFIGGLQEAWARAPRKWEYSDIMTSNSDAFSAPPPHPVPTDPQKGGKVLEQLSSCLCVGGHPSARPKLEPALWPLAGAKSASNGVRAQRSPVLGQDP